MTPVSSMPLAQIDYGQFRDRSNGGPLIQGTKLEVTLRDVPAEQLYHVLNLLDAGVLEINVRQRTEILVIVEQGYRESDPRSRAYTFAVGDRWNLALFTEHMRPIAASITFV